jgi:RNA polymerase sigma-70 factor, ECF subfamily
VTRDEILALLRERIVRFAASKLMRDAAEDVAQEVLIILHEKYGHVTQLEELVPLSLQIVRFKVMGMRRKAIRHGEPSQVSIEDVPIPDTAPDPGAWVERKQMLDRMQAGIAQLGERCRALFRLKLQGKTFSEIQQIMGAASINTVYTWDSRCRKNLVDLMGGAWEPDR